MSLRPLVVAVILAAAALIAPAAASAQSVTGADVSQWQGTIDWGKLGQSGIRFVFIKATEGTGWTDPAFARNRAGAGSAGLAAGFYHFARPAGSTIAAAQRDATNQANHFLAVYQPRPTDLRPVLDVEQTGGLSHARLLAWVTAWVNTVRARLHTRPLIYTSPSFWSTGLADSSTLAPISNLWIAHWTSAPAPWVPAANWGGKGWSFWQYSDCGHLQGIVGCVDRDRLNGSSLAPYRIGSAPTASTPPALDGSPDVGEALQTTKGAWTGTAPIALSYQWQRCDASGTSCQPIPGATEASYTPAPADYGATLRAVVRARNSLGAGTAATPVSSAVADHTPPKPPIVTPADRFPRTPTERVGWRPSDTQAGVTAYDVEYETLYPARPGTDWQPWTSGGAVSGAFQGQPGSTACFRARATDEAGNTSDWGAVGCVTFPFDEQSLGRLGAWRTVTTASATNGHEVTSSTRGAALVRRGVTARRIGFLADTCATCGGVTVSFNGQVVGRYSLHSATPARDVFISTPEFSTPRSGELRITVSDAHRPVTIDGVYLDRGM